MTARKANQFEKVLLSFPKRSWRKILKLSPQEREQAAREIAALIDATAEAAARRRARKLPAGVKAAR